MTGDYPTDEELAAWPDCATPDCEYKCCRIMGSEYCSPCNVRMCGITSAQWAGAIREQRIWLGLEVEPEEK